jgi:endonuclease YncB( thermonuclease family)
MRACLALLVSFVLFYHVQIRGAESIDGAHHHMVIAVDGPDVLRVNYHGLPVAVRLANVRLKGAESEKLCLQYLKSMLGAGSRIKLELEPDQLGDGTAPARVQVFSGTTHINLEMIKRGLCYSDGRSEKFAAILQAAQQEAMNNKLGLWSPDKQTALVAAKPPAAEPAKPPVIATACAAKPEKEPEVAPKSYAGIVVADLSSREYHYPGSRYAQNIRHGARIEYKNLEEAERAGKIPSPFSFPERAKLLEDAAAKKASGGHGGSGAVVDQARKTYAEALTLMQEARRLSQKDNTGSNTHWKKAAKLISDSLDRLTPLADANPSDKDLQKLTEEMSMSLYSCNKYQSL